MLIRVWVLQYTLLKEAVSTAFSVTHGFCCALLKMLQDWAATKFLFFTGHLLFQSKNTRFLHSFSILGHCNWSPGTALASLGHGGHRDILALEEKPSPYFGLGGGGEYIGEVGWRLVGDFDVEENTERSIQQRAEEDTRQGARNIGTWKISTPYSGGAEIGKVQQWPPWSNARLLFPAGQPLLKLYLQPVQSA